jgi:hypothetical protein
VPAVVTAAAKEEAVMALVAKEEEWDTLAARV